MGLCDTFHVLELAVKVPAVLTAREKAGIDISVYRLFQQCFPSQF